MAGSDVIVTVDNPVVLVTVGQQGPPGVSAGVTGTGFVHVTAGVTDPAARAVNLASTDVTGLLPVANIAPGSNGQVLQTTLGVATWGAFTSAPSGPAGGDLSGTYPNPQVASVTGAAGILAMATTAAALVWNIATASPALKQADQTAAATNGQALTVQAQNATGSGSNGGALTVTSGTGTLASGALNLYTGNAAVTYGDINLALGGAANNQISLQYNAGTPRLAFSSNFFLTPTLTQVGAAVAGATASFLGVVAQANTSAANNSTGGGLQLTGGASSAAAAAAVGGGITGASTANPCVITTASAHGLATGQLVTLAGIVGQVVANGTWPITVLTSTTFSIPVNGTGTYVSGGTVTPQGLGGPVVISSGAATTAGASYAGYVDLRTAGVSQLLVSPTQITVSQANPIVFGTTPVPTTGYIRFPNTGGVVQKWLTSKDLANTYDLCGVSCRTDLYTLYVGEPNLAPGSNWNSVTITASQVAIRSGATGTQLLDWTTGNVAATVTSLSAGASSIVWATGVTSVTYKQADQTAASTAGAATTIQAQNATGVTSTGGQLNLTSGTGTTAAGNVAIQTGGVTKINVLPTGIVLGDAVTTAVSCKVSTAVYFNDSANNTAITFTPLPTGATSVLFAPGATSVTISQATAAGAGATTTIQAQSSSAGVGGSLHLAGGSGSTTPNSGTVQVIAGSTTSCTFLAASIKAALPIWGDDSAPVGMYSVHGTNVTAVTTGGSTTTILSAVAASKHIQIFTGIPTAAQTIQLGPVADGWWKIVHNKCTGTFSSLTIKAASGATLLVSSLEKWVIWCDGTDLQGNRLT